MKPTPPGPPPAPTSGGEGGFYVDSIWKTPTIFQAIRNRLGEQETIRFHSITAMHDPVFDQILVGIKVNDTSETVVIRESKIGFPSDNLMAKLRLLSR